MDKGESEEEEENDAVESLTFHSFGCVMLSAPEGMWFPKNSSASSTLGGTLCVMREYCFHALLAENLEMMLTK